MKIFCFILYVCFALFITIESKEGVKKYTEELTNGTSIYNMCGKENGVDIEYVINLNKTDQELESPEMEETRTKIGCFLSCLMQEMGAMNGTEIYTEKITDILQQSLDSSEETSEASVTPDKIATVTNVAKDCVKQVGTSTNVCLMAWNFAKCVGLGI